MGYVFFGVATSCVLLRFFYSQAMIDMGNKAETALFIGNRDCYNIREADIEQAIIEAINTGIKKFLNGGQGHFDKISAIVLHRLKEQNKLRYSEIKSVLVIPYRDFWIFNKNIFDEIVYPFDPKIEALMNHKIAIPYRNKAMVCNASTAICFVAKKGGGAWKTLEYAKQKNLRIINIGTKYFNKG